MFSKEDATVIFRDAAIYNMTDAGHVWIVTEQALFSNNTPIGTLGLKLNNDNETEHIRVSRVCVSIAQLILLNLLNQDYVNVTESHKKFFITKLPSRLEMNSIVFKRFAGEI